MVALAASSETRRRDRLYAALGRRNTVVAVLRWIVPAFGVVVVAALVAGIVIDNLSNQFGFAKVHIDRDNLVVDTPALSSTLADGTAVALSAQAAKLALGNTDLVDLTGANFTASLPNGLTMRADASAAELRISDQRVTVPGTTLMSTNQGMAGTAEGLSVDVLGLKLRTTGAVQIELGVGDHLSASDMAYDHATRTWVFHNVRVSLRATPGDAE